MTTWRALISEQMEHQGELLAGNKWPQYWVTDEAALDELFNENTGEGPDFYLWTAGRVYFAAVGWNEQSFCNSAPRNPPSQAILKNPTL